jgi:integrase
VKTLRAFFSWCIAEELVTANPFARITISVPADPRPTASQGEIDKMLAHAKGNRRDQALLTLLCDSGCRKGELAALRIEHIDLSSGTVTFPVSKSRPRTVPLTDRAVVALGRWLRERGTGSGSLWSVNDPYSLIKAAVRRHSGGTLTPHTMRRAFAVNWLLKGGTEVGLMRVCGWSSREMINLYSRASADVLADTEFRRLMA